MDKTLVKCGNSLAVVVDASIRRVLGIGPRTRLKMYTDGKRLILEPLPPNPIAHVADPGCTERGDEKRLAIDAGRVFKALMRAWGMWQPQYDELTHRGDHVLACATFTELLVHQATTDDFELFRRLEAALDARQSGQAWEAAIATAIAKVPFTCDRKRPTTHGRRSG